MCSNQSLFCYAIMHKMLVSGAQVFYYRGCGWKPKRMHWKDEEKEWIKTMDVLFSNLFGPDYCVYEYTEKTKHSVVVPGQFPLIEYQHEEWEKSIPESNHECAEIRSSTAATATAPQQQCISTISSNSSAHLK